MPLKLRFAFPEHFPSPRCTCTFLEVGEVKRGANFFKAVAYLHILPIIPTYGFDDKFKECAWVFLEHSVILSRSIFITRMYLLFFQEYGRLEKGVGYFKAVVLLHILIKVSNYDVNE